MDCFFFWVTRSYGERRCFGGGLNGRTALTREKMFDKSIKASLMLLVLIGEIFTRDFYHSGFCSISRIR